MGVTSGEATPRSVHAKKAWLEIEPAGKLDDSWSSSRSRLAEQRTVDVVTWQTKVYGVEDVEEVGANRKASVLSYRETLDYREVDFVERRSIKLVTSDRALPSYCGPYGKATGSWTGICAVSRARIPEKASRRAGVRSRIVCGRCEIGKALARGCEISTLAQTSSGAIRSAENTERNSSL